MKGNKTISPTSSSPSSQTLLREFAYKKERKTGTTLPYPRRRTSSETRVPDYVRRFSEVWYGGKKERDLQSRRRKSTFSWLELRLRAACMQAHATANRELPGQRQEGEFAVARRLILTSLFRKESVYLPAICACAAEFLKCKGGKEFPCDFLCMDPQ